MKPYEYSISIPDDRDKKYKIFRYPAGEAQVRLFELEVLQAMRADCIRVTANIRDGEVMELALLTNALQNAIDFNGTYCQLILPYLPYGRADRKFLTGDCAGLATFAGLINSLEYNHVVTWDAHSEVAKDLIQNLVNLPSTDLILKVVNKIGRKNLLVLLPDKGAVRYEGIVKALDLPFVYGEKVRDAATGKLSGFKVPTITTPYKKILIVDDICDGGGTFLGLQTACEAALCHLDSNLTTPNYFLFVTHGIFSKGLLPFGGVFKKIFTSSSFGISKEAHLIPPGSPDLEIIK